MKTEKFQPQHFTSLSLEQIEALIVIAEKSVQESSVLFSVRKGPFEEAKLEYEMAKKEYDDAEAVFNRDKGTLECLANLRNNSKQGTPVRVVHQTSHLAKPPKESRKKKHDWKTLIFETLTRLDRFVTFEDLSSTILSKIDAETFNSQTFYSLKTCFRRFVARDEIIDYKNKFGLREWCVNDENEQFVMIPNPKHMKQFIFK